MPLPPPPSPPGAAAAAKHSYSLRPADPFISARWVLHRVGAARHQPALCATRAKFQDWSAAYRLFSRLP